MRTDYDYSGVYLSSGIMQRWHNLTWDDYIHEFYKKEVRKFVAEEGRKNVLLYGDNGMGKSMLMNLAMIDFIRKGFTVHVIDFRDIVKEHLSSWRGQGIMDRLLNVDYLAIDDLGKEFNSSEMSKELAVAALDYVLRHRFQRELPTWITFNMPLADIGSIYNEHIASLLKRSSVALLFEGDDFGDRVFKIIKKKNAGR
jgi:DNA replication protein DnaC